jgi:hypothetical protein
MDVTDPATLPPCCDGTAHCLPKDKVPGKVRRSLEECPGGYCVPDAFLRSGGAAPARCASIGGKDGACVSACVPEVKKSGDLLAQATCGAGEKCAPCIHPLTSKPTGVCEIGKDDAPGAGCGGGAGADGGAALPCPHKGPPVIDPNTLPTCGQGAHCLDEALVPAPMMAKLAPCAGAAKKRCVPDVFIAAGGRFVPKTCAGPGGSEGRCLHRALPDVAKKADMLSSAGCAPFERCAPCFDPIDGKDTGACRLSCDPGPTKPPYAFPSCCELGGTPRGRCVPRALVPDAQEATLGRDACAGGDDLCVPGENLSSSFAPSACTAPAAVYFGSYEGVCLSKCLQFSGIQDLVVKQGTCDDLHECVPCKKPFGEPTGAPGCK